MSQKLYVGNLSYSVDSKQLETWFTEFGTVASARVVTDGATGRSKGFGFVEMSSEDEATKARDSLNGKELGGRTLKVDIAIARERSGGGGRGGFRPRGGGGGGGRRDFGGGRGGGGGGRRPPRSHDRPQFEEE